MVKKVKEENRGGLFIPAGLFLGIGLGFLFGEIVAGTLIGLGVGFFVMAVANFLGRK